jgi:hypothetical protein
MDKPLRKINLLICRGVYLADIMTTNNIYDHKSSFGKNDADIVYVSIPKQFKHCQKWPTCSNLKCWSCDQLPISYPKFIPINPEKDNEGNDICDTYGHFCEWNCAVRYVIKEFPKEQCWDALEAICLFESKFSGKRREKIMAAPSKTLMKPYCGNGGISLKQWREELEKLNNDYCLTQFKLEHFKELD